jgi:hypothetical protein
MLVPRAATAARFRKLSMLLERNPINQAVQDEFICTSRTQSCPVQLLTSASERGLGGVADARGAGGLEVDLVLVAVGLGQQICTW